MKTRIIESVAEPVAPGSEYPALLQRDISDGKQIVIATGPSAGIQLAWPGSHGSTVQAWGEDSSSWIGLGFTPLTRPITIEFTP
jgi:hypothetical protein